MGKHNKFNYIEGLYFVGRASRYNGVKKNQLDAQFFLVYFVKLYVFGAYLGPSSGGTTVCTSIQHLVQGGARKTGPPSRRPTWT